ncbi:hypothetical protein [Paenibacillus sp. HGH0039]|uniref:hypothetical protein n=1 Tax=Paenibacillus sp. HGH0039 TaxID=1078505 RepID=UPI00056004CE|nr:hypothetical protein [Paenibacillus sp. HGH0039]
MTKKLVTILSTSLLVASLSSVTSVSANSSDVSPKVAEKSLISPQANSGWKKQNGIEARVYTNRTGSYPNSDTYIGVTAEKKTTGAAYYQLVISEQKNGTSYQRASKDGTWSGTSISHNFNIDDILDRNSQGTFLVRLKIFAYGDWDTWLGDWETETFTVVN